MAYCSFLIPERYSVLQVVTHRDSQLAAIVGSRVLEGVQFKVIEIKAEIHSVKKQF